MALVFLRCLLARSLVRPYGRSFYGRIHTESEEGSVRLNVGQTSTTPPRLLLELVFVPSDIAARYTGCFAALSSFVHPLRPTPNRPLGLHGKRGKRASTDACVTSLANAYVVLSTSPFPQCDYSLSLSFVPFPPKAPPHQASIPPPGRRSVSCERPSPIPI